MNDIGVSWLFYGFENICKGIHYFSSLGFQQYREQIHNDVYDNTDMRDYVLH